MAGDHVAASGSRAIRLSGLVLITCLAVATRLYKLEDPAHIAWDETHFGKFASFYINRTFFLDVHPPLGKMAIALAGHLTGYDGAFAFGKPSDLYGNTSYYGMRLFCASCGTLCVPLAYLTVVELSQSTGAAFITALVMIFDTGMLTISQYILLDPVLLVTIMMSFYFMAKTRRCHEQKQYFTWKWWICLLLTGVSLGCAISVKWVGLFIVTVVGIATVLELWDLFADVNNTMSVLVRHFLARAVCLIAVPVAVYLAWFAVHFEVLHLSGNGDAFFSPAFQSTLLNNTINNCSLPPEVAFGSVITLRNGRIAGGLLHSHPHLYPEGVGARQQQITVYHHRDDNNKWIVRKAYDDGNATSKFVKHGDFIRLEHAVSRRLLHSHHHKAPLSTKHYQVTGYGYNGSGDMNDIWQVQVLPGTVLEGRESPFVELDEWKRINVLKSRIMLIHNTSHCALHSSAKQLPKWAWEQKEVSCNPKLRNDVANTWIVEGHENNNLENATLETLRPSLLLKLYESHVVMATTNSGFKPKPNEQTSRPWMWPVNYQGQIFSSGSNDTIRVYLLGNPVVWWSNSVCVVLYIAMVTVYLCVRQRGVRLSDDVSDDLRRTFNACHWFFLGWLLHYLPFCLMARVLYFHHYFPAFMFNAMLSGTVIDLLLRQQSKLLSSPASHFTPPLLYSALLCGLAAVVLASFSLFHPLSYGMTGEKSHHPDSQMHGLQWLSSWEF